MSAMSASSTQLFEFLRTAMAARICLPRSRRQPGPQSRTTYSISAFVTLLLERGEIYYNNRKSELSADLHDLSLQSSFELLTKQLFRDAFVSRRTPQLQNANPLRTQL